MITSIFLSLPYYFIAFVISVIPVSTGFPAEFLEAVSGLGGYISMFDMVLPVATLGTVLGIMFSVEIGIFGFKTFKWVWSHIPMFGGRG